MKRRTQTTFTFKTMANAERFQCWLQTNTNDRDYGYPQFIDLRSCGRYEVVVEYSSESDFARGVATGIDLA